MKIAFWPQIWETYTHFTSQKFNLSDYIKEKDYLVLIWFERLLISFEQGEWTENHL